MIVFTEWRNAAWEMFQDAGTATSRNKEEQDTVHDQGDEATILFIDTEHLLGVQHDLSSAHCEHDFHMNNNKDKNKEERRRKLPRNRDRTHQ